MGKAKEKRELTEKTEKELTEKLIENMLDYRQRAMQLKELEKEQDFLKVENLALMNELGLEVFSHGNLEIEVKCNNKKIGVDEIKLASLIGRENTDKLKVVPIDAVLQGMKDGTLPPTVRQV